MRVYKPKELAKLINVSVQTLQNWDNTGRMKAHRTPTNRRFYTQEHVRAYFNSCELAKVSPNDDLR